MINRHYHVRCDYKDKLGRICGSCEYVNEHTQKRAIAALVENGWKVVGKKIIP